MVESITLPGVGRPAAPEPRPYSLQIPITDEERRAIALLAAKKLVSRAELGRQMLAYCLAHPDVLDGAED